MKLTNTILLLGMISLWPGCKPEPLSPMAKQILPHLIQLRDTPSQQQMFIAVGSCEELAETHGRETVADALKQVARQNPAVQDQAVSLLSRYVSVEDYGDFVKQLKTNQ